MRAEIAWLKGKVSEQQQPPQQQHQHNREDGASDSASSTLKSRLQREERRRKEMEVLLAMWRTRCERAEADLARLRSIRGDRHTATASSSGNSVNGSAERVRGRSRERQFQPPSYRSVNSRSVSPSYMRPTSSTAAKQLHSPQSASRQTSPRPSSALASAASSRAASPRARTTKPQRSPTPPPLNLSHPRIVQPPRPRPVARRQRSVSPNPASGKPPRLTADSTSGAAFSPTSPSFSHRSTSHRPPSPAGPTAITSNSQLQDSTAARWSTELSSEQKQNQPSDASSSAVSTSLLRPFDVHSRLTALQNFLRQEKAKVGRRAAPITQAS